VVCENTFQVTQQTFMQVNSGLRIAFSVVAELLVNGFKSFLLRVKYTMLLSVHHTVHISETQRQPPFDIPFLFCCINKLSKYLKMEF
jgi:hypothetical protein